MQPPSSIPAPGAPVNEKAPPLAWDAAEVVTGATVRPQRAAARLRGLITGPQLSFLMEAHNGLSAKIVEEAGFEGIWASGLSISASLGLRDHNEASWTQVLEVAEFMADATTIPILLDGDTGYGDFNSTRRLVRKLEQRGIAGVCIEDKAFPKTNSFVRCATQPLAEIDEFAGKIKAGKDAQSDDDFVLVARVEAFVAGWGLGEALRRAEAYRTAGADAILVHSALPSPAEVLAFKREWGDRAPVVIVPTRYFRTPTQVFRDHRFSTVIWANHLMRAALSAMRRTAGRIHQDQSLRAVEGAVATLADVFELQGEPELEAAERRYLPRVGWQPSAVVLAASRGKELGALTADRPKCMLAIAGEPVLSHIAAAYRGAGIGRITVVRGYRKHTVDLPSLDYVDNDDFATTNEAYSLLQAAAAIHGTCVISYGDVLFRKYVVEQLLETQDDLVIAVDINWRDSRNRGRHADYVRCSAPHSRRSFSRPIWLEGFTTAIRPAGRTGRIDGEWMGLLKVSPRGAQILRERLHTLDREHPGFRSLTIPDLLGSLLAAGQPVRAVYTTGHWLDIDTADDLATGATLP
jgi:phosphoenolpyruvate phosphomutase